MSAKHTPGQWWVGGIDSDEVHCRIFAKEMGCNAHIKLVDAPSVGGLIPDEQLKANARLIAAAPDLLEALKACDEAMSYMSEYDIPITLRDMVKAAIAKAIG